MLERLWLLQRKDVFILIHEVIIQTCSIRKHIMQNNHISQHLLSLGPREFYHVSDFRFTSLRLLHWE